MWKFIILIVCLFGISLAGIVIGWINWRLTETGTVLTRSGRKEVAITGLLSALIAGLLTGVGVYFFFDSDPFFCTAAAVLAVLVIYATLRLATARG